jgi:hypothetical protein
MFIGAAFTPVVSRFDKFLLQLHGLIVKHEGLEEPKNNIEIVFRNRSIKK